MSAVANIFREKAILIEVQHPFVVNLRYAFQDEDNMFMVIDLMLGGDLRYQLDKNQSLTEEQVRKPENILLDEFGHAHLTDFNIAVHFLENRPLTSRSGTHSYMAPEVFGKVGYKWQVDWWSLGIVFFEILFGKRPFRGPNQEETAHAICTQELTIPDINLYTNEPLIVTPACGAMVLKMLERNIPQRMCCGEERFEEFKKHDWFADLDWDMLVRKEIPPPFVPESNKDNFDISHDLEELLLDDNPLRYKKEVKPRKSGKAVSGSKADDDDDDDDDSGDIMPKVIRANRSDPGENNQQMHGSKEKMPRQVSVNSVACSVRYHPLDYDPYLQALQRDEHPTIKGKSVTAKERMELELQYIKDNFTEYNCERDGRGKNDLGTAPKAEKVKKSVDGLDQVLNENKKLKIKKSTDDLEKTLNSKSLKKRSSNNSATSPQSPTYYTANTANSPDTESPRRSKLGKLFSGSKKKRSIPDPSSPAGDSSIKSERGRS